MTVAADAEIVNYVAVFVNNAFPPVNLRACEVKFSAGLSGFLVSFSYLCVVLTK